MSQTTPTIKVTFTPPTDVDLTGYCRSFSIQRGRSGPFDAFGTGTATITLDNRTRLFDPLNAAGTYYGKILPGRKVQILSGATALFVGTVEDWDHGYDLAGDSIVTLKCEDAFGPLARKSLPEMTNAIEDAGTRIDTILNLAEVAYAGTTSLDDGGWSELQADTISAATNALNYLQLINRSDAGRLFIDRSGVLTFRDRHSFLGTTAAVTFGDTGSDVRYSGISLLTGTELLRNDITIERSGGVAQTSSDATSITAYDIRHYGESGLLMNYDTDAYGMADWFRIAFKDPVQTIDSVTVNLGALSANVTAVCQLDVASVVRVKFTPNRTGSAIDQTLVVEGVEHSQTRGAVHLVTLRLAKIALYEPSNPFILDTSVLDGSDVLAF